MVDKIFVKPDEVRGLGNIVSPSKTLDDFTGYSCNLTFQDDEYTMTYESNERVWVDTGSGSYNYGEAVDLSAHINTRVAGLTMQFFDGETLIGEATTDSNGEALTWITTLSAGVHIITAKCKGITSSNSARVTIILEYDGFEIIETSNKTILSAYDEDVAVFHVQLTLDGEPVAKQGVSVNWYKDNVLVSTKSTMSSGWCEFGYDAVGAGDITFRADVNVNGRLVSKIYEVEDCTSYDASSYNSDTTVNIALPSEFIITWQSNRKSGSTSVCKLNIGSDDNNMFQCGSYGSAGNNGLQERINGTWQTAQNTSNSPLNTVQNNTLKYENGVLSYSNGSQTVSKTPTISLEKLLHYGVGRNGLVQNVKVKPL